jgi:hypothetical protein
MIQRMNNYFELSCDICGKKDSFKFESDLEAAIVAKYITHYYEGSPPVIGDPFVCPICAANVYFDVKNKKGENHE